MKTLEMIHYKEDKSGSVQPNSAWTDSVDESPSQDEISEILDREISGNKSPNLVQVCLNVWEGSDDEWNGTLIQSRAKDVLKEAKRL